MFLVAIIAYSFCPNRGGGGGGGEGGGGGRGG